MDRRRVLLGAVAAVAAIVLLLVLARPGSPPGPDNDGVQGRVQETPATAGPERPEAGRWDLGGLGYPRTPEGAVAAATAYGLALDGIEMFDPTHRAAVLDTVAADRARDELAATFTDGLELIRRQLDLGTDTLEDQGFVWRVVPGGWQLRAYDGSEATVAVWAAVVVLADDRLLVEPGWQTSEVALIWEHDGWRLVGFRTEPGPNPAFAAGTGGEPIGRQINAFAPYLHWPAPGEGPRP